MEIKKRLNKYIFQNIFAMLGMSLYILADTIFISLANGSDGLTSLNLTLPLYSIVYATGAMIGVGSAIKFALYINTNKDKAKDYFSNAVIWNIIIGLITTLIFWFFSENILRFLGADDIICPLASSYIKWAMIFATFFMMNFTFVGFVRNDKDPSLAMMATLISCLSNAVLDYVFMFPMGLGMMGAALATGVSPIISIIICSYHFKRKDNQIHFRWMKPSFSKLIEASKLGISAFIGEISGGFTTLSFNYILLNIGGNIYVAAYGVISNVAIIATAIFNGIAQGLQPLASEYYGLKDYQSSKKVFEYSNKIAFFVAIFIISLIFIFNNQIVSLFNSEGSKDLAFIASSGIKLYFIGYLFAGMNIIKASYFSATTKVKGTSIISVLRGVILIVLFAFLLSFIFGIKGVWLSFFLTECVTYFIGLYISKRLESIY